MVVRSNCLSCMCRIFEWCFDFHNPWICVVWFSVCLVAFCLENHWGWWMAVPLGLFCTVYLNVRCVVDVAVMAGCFVSAYLLWTLVSSKCNPLWWSEHPGSALFLISLCLPVNRGPILLLHIRGAAWRVKYTLFFCRMLGHVGGFVEGSRWFGLLFVLFCQYGFSISDLWTKLHRDMVFYLHFRVWCFLEYSHGAACYWYLVCSIFWYWISYPSHLPISRGFLGRLALFLSLTLF